MRTDLSVEPILPGIYAHSSGALWLSESRTAVVADLHLGFAWAERRRGTLWPLTDGGAYELLVSLCNTLQPERMVLLGDITHAPRPCAEESEAIERTLSMLRQRTEVLCVRGNHDRGSAYSSSWHSGSVLAVHGDKLPERPPDGLLVAGHFHPVLRIRDSANVDRPMRAFLFGAGLCVLPAFSPFAAGCDMRCDMPGELRTWFKTEPVSVILTSGAKTLRLPPYAVAGGGLRRLHYDHP